MQTTQDARGSIEVALQHTARLLQRDPKLAAEQAAEILKAVPGHPVAQLYLGVARRGSGDANAALTVLEELARAQPRSAATHYELGVTLGALGRGEEAVAALRCALQWKADLPDAWRALADHLSAMGDVDGADAAYAQHIRWATRDPRLLEAGVALVENRIAIAEALLRQHLKQFPTDVAAMRMLAEVAARLGRYGDAESLLTSCLELAPGFAPARHHLAVVLHRQAKTAAALPHVEQLLEREPRNPGYRNLKAALLSRLGEYDEAIELYAEVLGEYPKQPRVWMSHGHALKTAGRRTESIEAYRRTLALQPGCGEAWWSLANLKTFRFEPADVDTMRAQLQRETITAEDRFHLHFALGKAYEDAGEYAASFTHYAQGNRLRRAGIRYDPDELTGHVRRSKALFTPEFFAARAGAGSGAPDPIFVLGLPRAGSTLIEQILASHPQVEGTMELPDLLAIARALGGRKLRSEASKYPEVLAELDAEAFRELGERYLEQTRIQRKTAAPHFIDKMPNNFAHVGLIHLILPNARIIDARRHPLGCCFSGFKQHFARGQNFSYSLEDIGRYYRDYVECMAHFDAVLPGRVHRVLYERLVEDPETEVRRLLAYCGLPFDARCLRFYETERAVRTASSEQVRTPLYREGLDQWRHFEPWLAPLEAALGPVLDAYPAVPAFSPGANRV